MQTLSLRAIDVGFSLRHTGHEITLPDDDVVILLDTPTGGCVELRGPAVDVADVLTALGYRAAVEVTA